MDKKPHASARVEKNTEAIPFLANGETLLKDIVLSQHQDLVMVINKQT
jgi:hypothetical protein